MAILIPLKISCKKRIINSDEAGFIETEESTHQDMQQYKMHMIFKINAKYIGEFKIHREKWQH